MYGGIKVIKREVTVRDIDKKYEHPLAEIVQIASQYKSEVLLEYDKYRINAKSIMGIIAFNPSEGMNVVISADGNDEADAYKVGPINAAAYNLRENGLADKWIVADATGTSPGTIIRFIPNGSKPVSPTDIDNVSGPAAMVVDTIDEGVDDEDNTIYTINGYSGGSEVSVTTNKTSALGTMAGYNSTSRKYTLDADGVQWTANSSDSLANYLHTGDIVITDGTYILIYTRAADVYNTLKADPTASASKYISTSETRNYFWFDKVTDADVDDVAWMKIGSNSLSADAGMAMDVVEIDLTASNAEDAVSISDDVSTISDVEPEGRISGEYDYGFARFANKGALQQVILYRIKY